MGPLDWFAIVPSFFIVLTWVIYFLSLHPECQEKLFAEIKETVKDDKVTADHIKELK